MTNPSSPRPGAGIREAWGILLARPTSHRVAAGLLDQAEDHELAALQRTDLLPLFSSDDPEVRMSAIRAAHRILEKEVS